MIDAIDPDLVELLDELARANGESEHDELSRLVRLWEILPPKVDNVPEGAS